MPTADKNIRRKYARHYDKAPIDDKLILYETRDGKSIVDSPLAMFIYLAKMPQYQYLRHVWAIDADEDPTEIQLSIPPELRGKITFVTRDSDQYISALSSAHYLINNSTFGSYFTKREGQVYVNTWHGTPLKHMGFDTGFNADSSKNVLRNLLMADYILSPNSHTTDVFTRGYKLEGLYSGEILEGGYPRIDYTLNTDARAVIKNLKEQGLIIDPEKKNILYTPTWKGENVNQATDDIEQIIAETQALISRFKNKYNVLLKVHPFAFNSIRDDPRVKGHLISNYYDANVLLAAVDLLITDYSSIFFDFLVTGRPIVFYAWDRDLYNAERGMYFPQDKLPGPTAENLEELIQTVANIEKIEPEYRDRYEDMKEKIVPQDDGGVTRRYVEYIFNGTVVPSMKIIAPSDKRTKLLIYPGGMKNNGITSSLMNLLNNIDYSNYDVTVLCNLPRNRQSRENIEALNENVRPMFRFGNSIFTAREELIDSRLAAKGVSQKKRKQYPSKAYRREMARLTGGAKFDVAIDFSGYSYFWARHILAAQANKYIAFMHNDLDADSKREVNGNYPMYRGLHGIFTVYYRFDRLLSVSKMTRDVNLQKLSAYVKPEQMGYVTNTINIKEILSPTISSDLNKVNDSQIHIQRESLRVIHNQTVKAFVNLADIALGDAHEVVLNSNSKILSFASITLHGTTYYKLSVDAKYVGWVANTGMLPAELHLTNIIKVRQIATVAKFMWSGLFPVLKEDHDSDQMQARAVYLKNHYVKIDKIGDTSDGRYAHIIYQHQPLGWMPRRSLARIHSLSNFSPAKLYFYTREQHNAQISPVKLPKRVINVTQFCEIGEKIVDNRVWSWPKGTTNAEVRATLSEFAKLAFQVDEIVTNSDGEDYARLTDRGDVIGYTRVDNLINVDADQYDQLLLNRIQQKPSNLPEVDVTGRLLPKFDSDFFNVVNMGRLSPEKNQANLIRGFSDFVAREPNSRLYILGSGPLADELVETINELHMNGHVFLLGHVDRPFNFLKKCDLFILPSLYEGQPMVLLEALTLGMRILVSNIPANIQVAGREEKYGQLIQGTTPEAISAALLRAKEEKYKPATFDYIDYNKQAIQLFYKEITQ